MTRSNQTTAAFGPPPHASRLLLVGTASTLGQMQAAIGTMQPSPQVIGRVLCEEAPKKGTDPVSSTVSSISRFAGQLDARSDQVLVSLPASMAPAMAEVTATLDKAGLTWRFRPTLADQLTGEADSSMAEQTNGPKPGSARHSPEALDLARLIDRTPHGLDASAIGQIISGRTVMITGAGGSIGTELALAVSRFDPAKIVLVERAENPLFEIDQEIARLTPQTPRQALLHDVTQRERTDALVERISPEVIFHAAAHKHVPMMENHPAEAVENNLYGTRSIADAASRHGVERFVMISTDKAVNPSSVMGATKRLAELYIRHLNDRSACTFSMVRFGNVLASNCSVLTIWSRQLAHGGPITVTHPRMQRYFMTIAEAAGLVLQAGALSGARAVPSPRRAGPRGGEVFLLDMAKPIRILDLARRFIELHGLRPEVDLPIEITGIRPGEKLFEELSYTSEDMLPTAHQAVRIWNAAPPTDAHIQHLTHTFDKLRDHHGSKPHPWHQTPPDAITTALRSTIPEMTLAAAG